MQENNNPSHGIINYETGEIKDILPTQRIVVESKERKDAIKKAMATNELNKDIALWNKRQGGFIFVIFKYCHDIINSKENSLTPDDIVKLFYMATYADYDGYLIDEEGFINERMLKKYLLLTDRKCFLAYFNKFKSLNIITEETDSKIKINKDYFIKGEIDKSIKANYDYTRIYIKAIQYLYQNTEHRQHRWLGNYFKLIPYIHRQQNVLCHNPDSPQKEIKLMNVKELKEILGYSGEHTIRQFIRKLLSTRLSNGQSILGFFRTTIDEGESFVIVNPKVFYGGNFGLEEGKEGVTQYFKK